MHELGIASSIVEACAERAAGTRVLRVTVEVGELAAVSPEALRFCFDVCAEGTAVAGAELDIVEIPGLASCETCGGSVVLSVPYGVCACGGCLRVVRGRELRLREMEVV